LNPYTRILTEVVSRFLYLLYIAVDANFKLKGKERGLKDVELTPGWGAYVPQDEYTAHISNYVDQVEVCSDVSYLETRDTDGKYLI
jgi:hypothetical protein